MVSADGTVSVFTGTQAMGQGLETTYIQLMTELLQIDPARVRVVQGDTDAVNGIGSVGSRSAFVGGSAAVSAGRKAILRGTDLAAEALEASVADIEYRAGRFAISGTDRGIDWASLAARQPDRVIRVAATESPSQPSWPNGAMVAGTLPRYSSHFAASFTVMWPISQALPIAPPIASSAGRSCCLRYRVPAQ